MDSDKDLKEIFREEALELLDEIDLSLVRLADNYSDSDLINSIFRALHTIKGSGSMFGYTEIVHFTHAFESVFDRIRNGSASVTAMIIELSLGAEDAIRNLIRNEDSMDAKRARDEILRNLEAVTGTGSGQAKENTEREQSHNSETTFVPVPGIDPGYRRIGEILVDNKSISSDMVEKIKSEQKLFGEIAIEKGLASREDVENAIIEQTAAKNRMQEQLHRIESSTIRVKNEKLDMLVDLVGEFVTMQARLVAEAMKLRETEMLAIAEGMGRLTDDLRDVVMKTRMIPVSNTFNEYHRLVFELSRTLGKEIRLDITGGETEIDKNVIDALKDPIMHLIRNASDHGIEAPDKRISAGKPAFGTIALHAEHSGGRIVIRIADDGAGLNRDLIRERGIACGLLSAGESNERAIFNTIFEPGFSTADRTTDVSGRGVGMDVVKKNVENLRGSIALESKEGAGTTVTLSIPLTLAIIEGLLTRTGDTFYILNLSDVAECVDLTRDVTSVIGGNNLINLRGDTIPFVRLRDEFCVEGDAATVETMVIVENEGKKIGLVVDQVAGRCQSIIKPLSAAVRKTRGVAGATILGDGSVALILDVREITRGQAALSKAG